MVACAMRGTARILMREADKGCQRYGGEVSHSGAYVTSIYIYIYIYYNKILPENSGKGCEDRWTFFFRSGSRGAHAPSF